MKVATTAGFECVLFSVALLTPWALFTYLLVRYNTLEDTFEYVTNEPPESTPFGWRVCDISFEYTTSEGCTCSLVENNQNANDYCTSV